MTQGNVLTPFLEKQSFLAESSEIHAAEALGPMLGSPFVSSYELAGQAEFIDPEQAAYTTLAQELYDHEFDEALFELMTAARALHEEHLVSNAESVEGERLLTQHYSQLIHEAEATVDAFGQEFGARGLETLTEGELEAFAERYAPATQQSPEFEAFLGKWAKKLAKGVTGLAKKAGKLALKVGLGPILGKLVTFVKPLLRRVLQTAIGKLPEPVRPAAKQLADRILGRRAPAPPVAGAAAPPADGGPAVKPIAGAGAPAAPDDTAAPVQEPAGAGVTELQQEFDQQLASLFTASDEVELELEVARASKEARQQAEPVYSDLDRARETFVEQLHELKEGENPTPLVQNFLPALLPALRLGLRLAGRGRVVNFLANFLAKMIGKLVGPAAAPALSRAIVDAGLKLLSLETSAQDEARAAASSVAATVEETVRRVSALPDYVLDSQELLEGFALEAFEQAAAANLPPVLSEAAYRERPDLLEASGLRTCWVMLPMRRHKRYKKCGRSFRVRITPSLAEEVESFEGPLSDYLQEQLGVEEGAEVEAEVHLYETLPGTTLPDIVRGEAEALGTGSELTESTAELHPLTPRAAGLLLGQPRLGRSLPAWTNRQRIGVGQRLYRLSIPGKRLLWVPGRNGKARARRSGGLRIEFDIPKSEIRISILLSEVRSQRLAVSLRRQGHPGALAAGFRKYVARRLGPILIGERPQRIQIVHPGLAPGESLGAALKRLPADVVRALAEKLEEYLVEAFSGFVKGEAQRFVAAADDTADGVTLKFKIATPPGLEALGKALLPAAPATGVAEAIRGGSKPNVSVEVSPGHKSV